MCIIVEGDLDSFIPQSLFWMKVYFKYPNLLWILDHVFNNIKYGSSIKINLNQYLINNILEVYKITS